MDIWAVLIYFDKHEAWGDPKMMNGLLLVLLDTIRSRLHQGIIVHHGWEVRANAASQHPRGNAVDFHVKNLPALEATMKLLSILDELQASNHVGFGLYPDWKPVPGFHLDVRGSRARWGRIAGQYVSFEKALKELKPI
jgi:hypothetical protein